MPTNPETAADEEETMTSDERIILTTVVLRASTHDGPIRMPPGTRIELSSGEPPGEIRGWAHGYEWPLLPGEYEVADAV
jgi:hypothetical protein